MAVVVRTAPVPVPGLGGPAVGSSPVRIIRIEVHIHQAVAVAFSKIAPTGHMAVGATHIALTGIPGMTGDADVRAAAISQVYLMGPRDRMKRAVAEPMTGE